MKKIESMVIVGGGSSGWMTAAGVMKALPDIKVTLIESSDIPTIGVGESTIGSINKYLRHLGLVDDDWMKYCNATYKTTIDFQNWDGENSRVRYPFGTPTYIDGKYENVDWFVKKAINGQKHTPKDEYWEYAMPHSQLIKHNKMTDFDDNIPDWNPVRDTAYHMDAGLFGKYLKEKYCKPRGITHIVDDVIDFVQEENGDLDYVKTKKSGDLKADLYIDCTGFKSLMLEGIYDEPFISFSDKLINDKAVAIRIPYKDKEKELETATNATTLGSGWVWNIPLWNRIGTGYVYSSKFISPEDAEKEFKEYLINDRDVPHDREEIESIDAFHVDIKNGIHERNWVHNVVAVGLSNGFIEPLESTGLMLTHETIGYLIETLEAREQSVTGFDKEVFNKKVREVMSAFTGFIAAHYAFSERDDTPYWKYVTEELEYVPTQKTALRTGSCGEPNEDGGEWDFFNTIIGGIMIEGNWNLPPHSGVPFIMAGMGVNPITKSSISTHIGELVNDECRIKIHSNELQEDFIAWRTKAEEYALTLPSHYDYLMKRFYEDDDFVEL